MNNNNILKNLNNLKINYNLNLNTNIINNGLNIIYLNIRSIKNKLEQLESIIQTQSKTHIIILTETWLHQTETQF